MAHIKQFVQIVCPDGTHFSVEETPNKDPNRQARRVRSSLTKLKLGFKDVTTILSCTSATTGFCARFTYRCHNGIWDLEVRMRCFNDSIAPFVEWFDNLTYERTEEITRYYSHKYLW
jgi:hypothetical protein